MSTADGVSFDYLCQYAGVPRPVAEYPFAADIGRRWRFDWAWPAQQLALEIDGGGWGRGRHHRAEGFANDCEKLNTAICFGWRVLRVTPQQVRSGAAMAFVRRALELPEEERYGRPDDGHDDARAAVPRRRRRAAR